VLFHVLEYVDWPADAFPNETAPLQIGLFGAIPFPEALEVLEGKSVQGRRLVIKRLASAAEAATCQVVFFGAGEKDRLAQVLPQLSDRAILTVSEAEGFAERGGMVGLVTGQNRILLEINRDAARKARFSFSSQLLRLAKLAKERP